MFAVEDISPQQPAMAFIVRSATAGPPSRSSKLATGTPFSFTFMIVFFSVDSMSKIHNAGF
jgi:hypothetical protein